MFRKGVPTARWHLRWVAEDVHIVEPRARIGDPAFQTFWEYLALLLCLCSFAQRDVPIAVVGDNTGSLQLALSLSGSNGLLAISRELTWRQARFGWVFAVGHLPTESNKWADALSRMTWQTQPGMLPTALVGLPLWRPPAVPKIWKAALQFQAVL